MSEYDTNLVQWSREQADLLRRIGAGERLNDQVDWENVAEEIESLGNSDRRDLHGRIHTVLRHLIKFQVSPVDRPRTRWKRTIAKRRVRIERVLEDSTSLRQFVPEAIRKELPSARTIALLDLAEFEEQPAADPETLAFNDSQVLGPWLPD